MGKLQWIYKASLRIYRGSSTQCFHNLLQHTCDLLG